MKIKNIFIVAGLALFSSPALSFLDFSMTTADINIDGAAQKQPKGSLLGNGWQVFTPKSNDYLCEANMPTAFQYTPDAVNAPLSGISNISLESTSFPVFQTSVDGVGFIMGYRESGTSTWRPFTKEPTQNTTLPNTEKLFLEIRLAYVKTVSGEIKKSTNNRIIHPRMAVNCSSLMSMKENMGFLEMTSTYVTWKPQSCEIRTKRETVDLGTHELVVIRKLRVGDNFGFAQQSMEVMCPERVNIQYTIADNNNPKNIGEDVIQLENSADNPGFGVQMFESGSSQALKIGGDRQTVGSYQYPFANTTTENQVVRKSFDFKYIKLSDDIKASDGNAKVTVTLVYP